MLADHRADGGGLQVENRCPKVTHNFSSERDKTKEFQHGEGTLGKIRKCQSGRAMYFNKGKVLISFDEA